MTGWIASTLVASTALMLLVLALRRPVARAFGARVAYALWLLPALRMVLPPLPQAVTPALPAPLDLALLRELAATLPAADAPGFDWGSLALGVWLAVAVLWFVRALLSYRRFMARTLAGGALLRRERGVAVWLGGGIAGPLAAGVFARAIVLPRDFHARFAADEQRLALAHEAAHHARRDTAANAVALAVLALHWWNPIAHAAWRAFRADQELACDDLVLRDAGPEERHAYGSAVLKAAFGGVPAAACGMGRTGRAGELKRRLVMMAAGRRSARRTRLGQALAGAAIASGLALTATGGAAAERVRAIGERVREALPPVAPLPPLAPVPPTEAIAPMPPTPPVPPKAPRPARRVSGESAVHDDVARALDEAERAHLAALREAGLARTEGLRAAAQARTEADRARAEADRDRTEALREASRARSEALRESGQARSDALREAEQARREALLDRQAAYRDQQAALREQQAAMREAMRAHEEAARDAAEAREEALRAASDARAAVARSGRAMAISATSGEAARAIAATCARLTRDGAKHGDWATLALCDRAGFDARVRALRAVGEGSKGSIGPGRAGRLAEAGDPPC